MNENTPTWKWEEVATNYNELEYCSVKDAIRILTDVQEQCGEEYQKLYLDISLEEPYGAHSVKVSVRGYRQETPLEVEARVGKNKAAIEARRARLVEELRLLEGDLYD